MDTWFSGNGYGLEEATRDLAYSLEAMNSRSEAEANAARISDTMYTSTRNLGDKLTTPSSLDLLSSVVVV